MIDENHVRVGFSPPISLSPLLSFVSFDILLMIPLSFSFTRLDALIFLFLSLSSFLGANTKIPEYQ